jgi:peptide/nickel transport system substrate-binding protein
MDRRKFLQMAGVGAASPFFNLDALAQGQTDRVLIVTEMTPNSLDTHTVGANRGAYGVVWMTYDRLITFGTKALPNGVKSYDYFSLKPQLAENWEVAPDNSAVTFKLRRDATFHDGTPVKAQDVKWSFDRFVKVGGFPQRQMEQGSLTSVDQFEAVDDYTFKVKFLRADKLTMPSLAIVVPSVYNSELCKKNATASDPCALEWTKNNCAGSGAYKVESFKSSEQVVLARFDGWKGGTPPKFQRAMFRNVAAAGTRRALVEKGDADVSPDLPLREIADISATKKFRVESAPMANTLKYLALSTIIKPFDDVRVRQAVAYGIPYQKVIDSAVFGRAQPMFGASASAPTDASWPQPFPYT